MLAPITDYNTPLRHVPIPKSQLLLVADSPERLKALKTVLAGANFEITCVGSVDELRVACRTHHDLAVLSVEAAQVKPMLSALRSSAGHKTIMALVESSELSQDQTLAGLLPTFRAMPCNQIQIVALMQRFNESGKIAANRRPVFL